MCEPIKTVSRELYHLTCDSCDLNFHVPCTDRSDAEDYARGHIDPPTHNSSDFHHHQVMITRVWVVSER